MSDLIILTFSAASSELQLEEEGGKDFKAQIEWHPLQ